MENHVRREGHEIAVISGHLPLTLFKGDRRKSSTVSSSPPETSRKPGVVAVTQAPGRAQGVNPVNMEFDGRRCVRLECRILHGGLDRV